MESQRGKAGGKVSGKGGKKSIIKVLAKSSEECKKICSEQKTCLKSAFSEKSMQCRFKGKTIQIIPLFIVFNKISFYLVITPARFVDLQNCCV